MKTDENFHDVDELAYGFDRALGPDMWGDEEDMSVYTLDSASVSSASFQLSEVMGCISNMRNSLTPFEQGRWRDIANILN